MESTTSPQAALPRLLAGIESGGAVSLAQHASLHGELPFGRGGPGLEALAVVLHDSGLRGRGGAEYPTAAKLRAVARERGGRPVVVVNGAEGEPASHKDRILLERLPHLVLDGAHLAASALEARETVVTVPASRRGALSAIQQALYERAESGWEVPPTRVVAVPESYVAGEETSLVRYLNGGPALPTFIPPRPFQRGVGKAPTLVSNVETLAHAALIVRHGADWYRQVGTVTQPGSALVTVTGAVAAPGVYEVPHGIPAMELLAGAGDTTAPVRALLLGGYAGAWIDAGAVSGLTLDNESLARHGASFGPGIVVVLSGHACPVAEVARVAAFLAHESAGQCGPCVHGLRSIAEGIGLYARGAVPQMIRDSLPRWFSQVSGRGACHHPDGAVRFVASALSVFEEDFSDHARHGPCDACAAPPELPLRSGGFSTLRSAA